MMLRKVMYNCREATLLIVKREQGRISLLGRFRLYYHLLHCGVCRSFQSQSMVINSMVRKLAGSLENNPPYKLSDTTAQKFSAMIAEETRKNIR